MIVKEGFEDFVPNKTYQIWDINNENDYLKIVKYANNFVNNIDSIEWLEDDNGNGYVELMTDYETFEKIYNYSTKFRKFKPEINEDINTISIDDIDLNNLEKFIYNKLDETSLWVNDIDIYKDEMSIFINIEIDKGDWKHEHKRLDFLLYDIIYEYNSELISNFYKIEEEVLDDTGTDSYSAIHKYEIEVN